MANHQDIKTRLTEAIREQMPELPLAAILVEDRTDDDDVVDITIEFRMPAKPLPADILFTLSRIASSVLKEIHDERFASVYGRFKNNQKFEAIR